MGITIGPISLDQNTPKDQARFPDRDSGNWCAADAQSARPGPLV